jgi:hypothetical protein
MVGRQRGKTSSQVFDAEGMTHLGPLELPGPRQRVADLGLFRKEELVFGHRGSADHANGEKTRGPFAKIMTWIAGFIAEKGSHDTSDKNIHLIATPWIPQPHEWLTVLGRPR